MFDLVPFARARRKVADFDFQSGLVAQGLQLHLPKAVATAVAASAVGGNQQSFCPWMTAASQSLPPAPNGLHRELGGVTADADANPGFVVTQIVHAIGHGLAFPRIGKVMG